MARVYHQPRVVEALRHRAGHSWRKCPKRAGAVGNVMGPVSDRPNVHPKDRLGSKTLRRSVLDPLAEVLIAIVLVPPVVGIALR